MSCNSFKRFAMTQQKVTPLTDIQRAVNTTGGSVRMVYDLSFLTVCICSDPYLEYTDKLR